MTKISPAFIDVFFDRIVKGIFPQLEAGLRSDLSLAILFGKVTFDNPCEIIKFLTEQILRRIARYNIELAIIRSKLTAMKSMA